MPRLRLEPAGVELPVAPGERLLDALDEAGVHGVLPVRCRAGNCASCLVRVLRGGPALAPAASAETELLERLGATSDQRLGCQLIIEPDTRADAEDVAVVIRVIAPGAA